MADMKKSTGAGGPPPDRPAQQPLRRSEQEREMWHGLARMHALFAEWEAERRSLGGWWAAVLGTLVAGLAAWGIALLLGWGSRHY